MKLSELIAKGYTVELTRVGYDETVVKVEKKSIVPRPVRVRLSDLLVSDLLRSAGRCAFEDTFEQCFDMLQSKELLNDK